MGMIRIEGLCVNSQRPPIQRFRLRIPTLRSIKARSVAEARRQAGMLCSQRTFLQSQNTSVQGDGLGILPLGAV